MNKKQIAETLRNFDTELEKLEKELERVSELRREFINKYNLNKETSNDLCIP